MLKLITVDDYQRVQNSQTWGAKTNNYMKKIMKKLVDKFEIVESEVSCNMNIWSSNDFTSLRATFYAYISYKIC